MVGGWIASYVFIFIFWSRCCCCCCLRLLLPTTSLLKRCFSAISPPLGLVSSRGLRAAIALSREGLARVRIRPRRGRRAALARRQGRVSAVSHTRPNHSALELFLCDFSAARPRFVAWLARSDSPHSRRPCPRADPFEIADDKGSSFPIVLLFVVVLRILYWAQYVRTCSTRQFTMHGRVYPVESRMTKRVVLYHIK